MLQHSLKLCINLHPPDVCALTAGLVNSKLKEELSHINHTVVFVHNDKTTTTHHGADGD